MLASWLGFAAYLTFDPQTHFLFFSALLLHQAAGLSGLYSNLLHPLALVGFRQWECSAGCRKARRDREDGIVVVPLPSSQLLSGSGGGCAPEWLQLLLGSPRFARALTRL